MAKLLWDAWNHRNKGTSTPGGDNTDLLIDGNTPRQITVNWYTQNISGPIRNWQGNVISAGVTNAKVYKSAVFTGVGIRIGASIGTQGTTLAQPYYTPPVVKMAIQGITENGPGSVYQELQDGPWYGDIYQYSTSTNVVGGVVFNDGTRDYTNVVTTPAPEFAPGTRPEVPEPQPLTGSPTETVQAPYPVPTILPATVPGATPTPAPAGTPGGLPADQPATPPDAATVPNIVRTVTTSSPGSQTQTITAGGVSQAPAAPIVPVTPAEAVLIGSQLVGGPGSNPPQGPGGTAAELGRLEGKSELTLSKLSQLAPLLESIDVLQALGEWLLSANGGVTYTLQPPCGTDANGDPLPPVEVVVPPTIGVEVATLARLDALAMLIDEHKQMRQPICKGKPTGSPVTVTAVEVE